MVLTACAGASDSADATTPPATTPVVEAEVTAPPAETTPPTEPAADAADAEEPADTTESSVADSSDIDSGSAATRTVTHLLGESEVPVEPERIAVLGRRGTLPILLDLGFEPVGAVDASPLFGDPFHPLIMDRATAAGVEPIPFGADGPNLEAVALLQPDLIIGNLREYEAVAIELQQIAPVIALEWDFVDPVANVHNVAELMGVPDEADALVAGFEADLAAASGAATFDGTVSIAGFFGPDDLRVYRGGNVLGQLVTDFGGQLVPSDEQLPLGEDSGVSYISQENIDVLSGDRLISFVNLSSELRSAYEEQTENPLVQALPSFQNEQVLEIDPQLVFGSAGLEGLELVVSQLAEFFAS